MADPVTSSLQSHAATLIDTTYSSTGNRLLCDANTLQVDAAEAPGRKFAGLHRLSVFEVLVLSATVPGKKTGRARAPPFCRYDHFVPTSSPSFLDATMIWSFGPLMLTLPLPGWK